MERDNNLNFEPNNTYDPVPETIDFSNKGAFSGADNRYCSGETQNRRAINSEPPVSNQPESNYNSPYQQIPQYPHNSPQKQEPKKVSKGLVAFLIVMCVVMVGTVAFFAIYLMDNDKSGVKANPFEDLYPDESQTVTNDEYPETYSEFFKEWKDKEDENADKTAEKLITNKNWKGLVLNKQASSKTPHSAQSAYEKVSGATVAVMSYTEKIEKDSKPDGQGTGMIISSDGYIVTNSHVIGDSKTAYYYEIIDNNGKKYTPTVIGYDTRTDIAVLKIKATKLPYVTFGKSDDLRIGDDIIAVGNPGGIEFQNSLTKGIVSAKGRSLGNSTVTYIQTDAAINPGNSGGPLCNLYGQVVGINTAKINSSIYEGMGFAIPSETVKKIVDDIIKLGYVSNRVRIGITGVALSDAVVEKYSVPQGIMITTIDKDGSIYGTPIEEKDIITALDGEPITSFKDIYAVLENHTAGDKVKIEYCHVTDESGKKHETKEITITLVADNGNTLK